MEIRLARTNEDAPLQALVERAYGVYVEDIGRRPAPMDDDYAARIAERAVHVAVEGDELLGLVVLIPGTDHLLVENVAVDPGFQQRGVGRALLAHAEATAEALALGEVLLYTNAAMTGNLELYRRLGYREVDRRSERGFERVYFAKSVAPPGAEL